MGLFASPCENPDCSASLKKGAQFCSHCGWAGANSLTACSDCGKRVGRSKKYCWNCGADNKEPPLRIYNGRWIRNQDEIAVRVNAGDVEGFLKQKVMVDTGTVGVVERTRELIPSDTWQTHTLDSVFKMGPPDGIVLVADSDIVIRPVFRGLRDQNGAEFELMVQAALRVADFGLFVKTFFDGPGRRVTRQSLEERLVHELLDVLRSLALRSSLEEMYGNRSWRDALERDIRASMDVTLSRCGLELVQVNFVDLGGDHYEKLRKEKGKAYERNHTADVIAEKLAILTRVEDLNSEGKLADHVREGDTADKIDELNVQYDVRKVLRKEEREETIAQAVHELALKNQLRGFEAKELEVEQKRKAHEGQLAWDLELKKLLLLAGNERAETQNGFEREQAALDTKVVIDLAWDKSEARRREARAEVAERYQDIVGTARAESEAQILRVQSQLEALKHENLSEDAKLTRTMEYEKHVSELKLSDKRLEQEEMKILLEYKASKARIKAEASVSADGTRAAVAEAVSKEKDTQIRQQQEATQNSAAAYEKGFDTIERITGSLAKGATGGVGTSGGSNSGGGPVAKGTAPCPKCNKPVEISLARCPHCDKLIIE